MSRKKLCKCLKGERMEIRLLQEFVSLVETQSFQETSEQMNISQSALTKHIHKMEEELGVSLFDRSTRSVGLNDFSQAYYPYAKQIVRLYEEANTAVLSIQDKERNVLRVAFTPALAHYGIVEDLAAFSREHPEFQLKITESSQVIELLNARKCDFAFASENNDIDSRMNQLVYKADRLVVVLPASHPLAAQKEVVLDQIKGERFIMHHNSAGGTHLGTRKFLELCKERNFKPKVAATVSFTSTITKMVSQEQGIAVLHRNRVPKDVDNIVVVELTPPVRSYVYALYLNKKRLPRASSAFLRYLISHISEAE